MSDLLRLAGLGMKLFNHLGDKSSEKSRESKIKEIKEALGRRGIHSPDEKIIEEILLDEMITNPNDALKNTPYAMDSIIKDKYECYKKPELQCNVDAVKNFVFEVKGMGVGIKDLINHITKDTKNK
jgi:hypothetical protein